MEQKNRAGSLEDFRKKAAERGLIMDAKIPGVSTYTICLPVLEFINVPADPGKLRDLVELAQECPEGSYPESKGLGFEIMQSRTLRRMLEDNPFFIEDGYKGQDCVSIREIISS